MSDPALQAVSATRRLAILPGFEQGDALRPDPAAALLQRLDALHRPGAERDAAVHARCPCSWFNIGWPAETNSRLSRFEIAGVAVLLAAALSSLWASYAIEAWKTVGGLLLIGLGYRVARSAAQRQQTREVSRLTALLSSGAVQALFAMHQFIFSDWYAKVLPGYFNEYIQPSIRGGIVRAVGGFIDPNNLAAYLNICFAVALAMLLFASLRWPAKAGLALAALLFLAGILLSGSKAGLVVTVLIAAGLLMLRDKRLVAVIILIVVAALVVPNPVRDQFFDTIANDPYFGVRLDIWGASLSMAADHPLIGVGAGNYPFVAQRYAPATEQFLVHYSHVPTKAHNSYLHAFDEWGMIGFLPLALMVLFALQALFASAKRKFIEEKGGALRLGFAAAIAGLMIHSLVHNTLHNRCLLLTGLVLMAALSARFSRERGLTFAPFDRRYSFKINLPANVVTVASVAILFVGFAFAQIVQPLNYETAMADFNARLGSILEGLQALDRTPDTPRAEYAGHINALRALAGEMEVLTAGLPCQHRPPAEIGFYLQGVIQAHRGPLRLFSCRAALHWGRGRAFPRRVSTPSTQFDMCTELLRYGYPRTQEIVEKMETLAQRMIERWPNRASFHLLAAGVAAEHGPSAWPRIKTLLQKAIELEPNYLQAISELERLARLAGEDETARRAERHFSEAVARIQAGPPPARDDSYARQILRRPAGR